MSIEELSIQARELNEQIDALIEKINRLDYFIDMYYEELENDEQNS